MKVRERSHIFSKEYIKMEKKAQLNFGEKDALFDDNSAAIDDYDDDDESDDDDFADIANPVKIRPNLTNEAPRPIPPFSNPVQQNQNINNNNNNNDADDDEEDDDDDDDDSMTSAVSKQSGISNESEKLDLLMKLDNLRSRGHIVRDYDLTSKLLDIKKETHRIQRSIEVNSSIKFQQKMLMALVSGLEYGNKRFDPFSIDLEGWSENVFENIEDFNTVFERLYDKYRKRGEMSPEIELMLTLAGSAFMFNMSNQLFKSVNQPFQGQMRNLRESVKNAFNQSQNQNQNSQNQNQRQQVPLSASNIASFQDIGASVLNSVFNKTKPNQNNSEPETNVRNVQLETFKNSNVNNENELLDHDRFSIASSSSDSVIEPPYVNVPVKQVPKKKLTKKKAINVL